VLGEPPQIVATSPTKLLALVDGKERQLDSFAPGHTVVVAGPEDATLTLASGQRLTLEAPAALRFGGAGETAAFRVLAGSVRVTNDGNDPLALAAPQCEIVLDPAATSVVDVLVHPWRTPEAFVRAIRTGGDDSEDSRETVVFTVAAGTATFVRPKTKIGLKPDEFITLWPDAEIELAPLPSAEQRSGFDAFLAKARVSTSDVEGTPGDRMLAAKRVQAASDGLTFWLRGKPEAWPWARPYLHRLPLDPKRNDAKRRLLQVLSDDGHPRTRELFGAVLAADPVVIDLDTTLLLAEGGLEAAERRLRAILAEPGATGRANNVYPALYFAVRGDNVGLDTFRATVAQHGWNKPAWYAAVAGLELLGDDEAWDLMVAQLEALVKADDAGSRLLALRSEVLTASYFHGLVGAVQPVPVSYTRNRALTWARRNEQHAQTLDQIRSLFESIRKTGR